MHDYSNAGNYPEFQENSNPTFNTDSIDYLKELVAKNEKLHEEKSNLYDENIRLHGDLLKAEREMNGPQAHMIRMLKG